MVSINMDNDVKITDDYKPGDTLMQVADGKIIDDVIYFVNCSASSSDGPVHYGLVPIMTNYQNSIEASFNSLENLISYYHRQKVCFTKCDVSISVRLDR